jgi:NADPH-dependent 2,4-dienoyl-CoA reductase/sulfur reductase-like enzyme
VPNAELARHLGCVVTQDAGVTAVRVDEHQATSRPGIFAAGENTGIGGSDRALVQGAIAGHAAVGDTAKARALGAERQRWNGFATTLQQRFALGDRLRRLAGPDTLVCRCEDVTQAELAPRTGWTDAKLHTRCGMGACQGRVCGAATQFMFGWTPGVPRPPLSPVRVATLAALPATAHSAKASTAQATAHATVQSTKDSTEDTPHAD